MSLDIPRKHFDDDYSRAKSLHEKAEVMENNGEERLAKDTRLSAVAMSVGAMDAYFCDAYVDCFTSVLRAYANGEWKNSWPNGYLKQDIPAEQALDALRVSPSRSDRPQWALRMTARNIMDALM
jgi:hypothetical protein